MGSSRRALSTSRFVCVLGLGSDGGGAITRDPQGEMKKAICRFTLAGEATLPLIEGHTPKEDGVEERPATITTGGDEVESAGSISPGG